MKILLVSNGFPPRAFGGVEVYVEKLARELTLRGHQIVVFCRDSNPDLPDYHLAVEDQDGVQVYNVVNDYKNIKKFDDFFEDVAIEKIFEQILSTFQPDFVHINHLIALSARLPQIIASYDIPFLITLHDYWPLCHRVNLLNWKDQLCDGPQNGGD